MTKNLNENLLKEFPGKMENEQAFIIQYLVNEARKGNKPPSKDKIEECIKKMVEEGIFDRKGSLLILKTPKPNSIVPEEEEEEEEKNLQLVSPSSIKGNYTENQKKILAAFEGKYENRAAIVMNATMADLSQGKKPPEKETLEKSIEELIEKGTLEVKGNLLIKKL